MPGRSEEAPVESAGEGLDPAIAGWVEQAAGGRLTRASVVADANRRQGWALDVATTAGRREFFLQFDPAPSPRDPFTIRREARMYGALAGTGVPVASLVALHPTAQAVLLERVPGSNAVWTLPADERDAAMRGFMEALARLHRLDPERVGLHSGPLGMREAILAEIDVWESIYRGTTHLDAMIEHGLRWLRWHCPRADEPARPVHGDAGPGNFLVSGGRVAALVDWEYWHLGDPLEDLAWLSMRWTRTPMPDFPATLRDYETFLGRRIDLDRLRYARVLVEWKIVVIRHCGTPEPERTGDLERVVRSRTVNRRLFLEALADAEGRDLDLPRPPDAAETPRSAVFDSVVKFASTGILPEITEPDVRRRMRNLIFMLHYLGSADRMADGFDRVDRAEVGEILGIEAADPVKAQDQLGAAVRDGSVSTDTVERYLRSQTARETAVAATALGPLATTHLPSLPRRPEPEGHTVLEPGDEAAGR